MCGLTLLAAILVNLLVAMTTTTEAKQCSSVRDVYAVIQLPMSAGSEERDTVKEVITKLHNVAERCWKLRTSVLDSEVIQVQKDGKWKPQHGTSTPDHNLIKRLSDIAVEAEDDFSPGSPKKLVLLVIGETPENPEAIAGKVKDLQELNCVSVVVHVNLSDEDKLQNFFKSIGRKDHRIIKAYKFQDLIDFEFKRLISLFEDPDIVYVDPSAPAQAPSLFTLENYVPPLICHEHIHIGFIIDCSFSMKGEYYKETEFVQKIAKAFNISRQGSQAAVITFSHIAKLSIKFNEHHDVDTFNNAVMQLKPLKYTTRIDLALERARDDMFAPQHGGGVDDTINVLILITDGKQTKNVAYTKPSLVADQIRAKGIHLLVIGVGNGVDHTELQSIAGPGDNWRKVGSFDELRSEKYVKKITRKTCKIAELKQTCEHVVDICFLFDTSGSIDKEKDFSKMKEFAVRIANSFNISATGTHGSLVVFSDFIKKNQKLTKVSAYLKDNHSPSQFRQAVEQSKYIGYRTRIDLGFQLAEKAVFNVWNGARSNVNKIIILLTDGRQNPKQFDPVKASQFLYDQGVKIFVVGIGRQIDHNQLKAITREKNRVFYADSFKELESEEFVKSVSKKACRVSSPTSG